MKQPSELGELPEEHNMPIIPLPAKEPTELEKLLAPKDLTHSIITATSAENIKRNTPRHPQIHDASKTHSIPRTEQLPDTEQSRPLKKHIPKPSPEKHQPTSIEEIKKKIALELAEKPTAKKKITERHTLSGIEGLDQLFHVGIPKGSTVLVCGGPGSGKTIFCLQTLYWAAKRGEKCFYMTFEESPERLKEHMRDFGWNPDELEKKGTLIIKKVSPLDITRQIDAMLEKAKGELLIDMKPLIVPKGFEPDRIAVDSLSSIASAFYGKEETYRLYIEQLFTLFNDMKATSFLISETPDPTIRLTASGVEEFLADGVIVLYNLRHGNARENAIEIIKMRGAGFDKKIAPLQIKAEHGIIVYPEQEVFTQV